MPDCRLLKHRYLDEEGDVRQRGVVDVLLAQEHIAPRLLQLRQLPRCVGLLRQLEQRAWKEAACIATSAPCQISCVSQCEVFCGAIVGVLADAKQWGGAACLHRALVAC